MFARSALVAGLATIGHAFLLPPSFSSADIVNSVPFETKFRAESRTLELECRRCPVPVKQHNELKWVTDVESKLKLQFDIIENEIDTLQLNGIQIYPPHGLPLEPIGAAQLTQENVIDDYTVFLNLGYELNVTPVMKSESDSLELILVHFQVVEIAGTFINGLDSVLLKLLKTPSGKLIIGDLGTGPTTSFGDKDCQTLMCPLKKIVTSKPSHPRPEKGCGSRTASVKAHPHGHTSHSSGNEAHRHHKNHGLSRFLRVLKRAAFHVLIPVLIGITAGFTASLLGVLVGQTAVFLWRTFYRHSHKGPRSRAELDETEAKEKDQEESLLEHMDPPPVYEDVVDAPESAELS